METDHLAGQNSHALLVFSLPIRDGNLVQPTLETAQDFVFSLPIRDGNDESVPPNGIPLYRFLVFL